MASEDDELSNDESNADKDCLSDSLSSRNWNFWDDLFSKFELCESCADSCAGPEGSQATDGFERVGVGPAKTHWVDILTPDQLERIVEGVKSDNFDCVLCELISSALPINLNCEWTVATVGQPGLSLWHDRRDKKYLQRIRIIWDSGRNPFQVGELVRYLPFLEF